MDWKETLGKIAPMLGQAVGGPVGGLAVEILGKALGLPEGSSEKDIANRVESLSGSDYTALRTAEMDYQARLKELELDHKKLHAEDRASARNREIQTGDSTPKVLGYMILSGFFVIIGLLLFVSIPEGSRDAMMIMLGALLVMAKQVIAYIYGSSAGSKAKTDVIQTMMKR